LSFFVDARELVSRITAGKGGSAIAGLSCETADQLTEALFLDGVSTRDAVTETSGRGVGMAALRRACQDLGGHIVVESVRRSRG
jgi:two-component system chemotaxis sensor kinase CheA